MKKIITYIFVLSILLVASCSEKLKLDPKQEIDDQTVFTSVNMLENAVTGTYDAIQTSELYGLNSISLADLRTEHIMFTGSWIAHRAVSIKAITTDNTATTSMWTQGYAAINAANRILKAVETGIDDPVFNTVKDRVAGEAYFLRALMYFELIKNFGKPYTAENMGAPGVPLILTATMGLDEATVKPSRASVSEVYTQIISDFKLAHNLLNVNAVGGGRANKAAAAAYLTRAYTFMGNWANAMDWSEALAASSTYGLDDDPDATFGGNFTGEMIFGIVNTSTDNVNTHMRWIYSPYNRSAVSVPPATMALFDAEDTRRNIYFDLNGKTWLNKYITDKDNIPLMRIAEVYLQRAEAAANLANLDEAHAMLNKIRTRAGLSNYSGLTQAELLERIKEETIKEFIGEGHAIYDLIRWQQQIGYSSGLTEYVNWDDPRNVYPIPQRERDVNPNLVQNEGY